MPAWAVVLIVLGVLAFAGAVVAAIAIPIAIQRFGDTVTEQQVRSGVLTIQTGIESYAREHGGVYPAPGSVDQADLGPYISAWPTNPYTRLPMVDGGGAGDFRYDVSSDGGAYKLIGYGRSGEELFELSGGTPTSV